MVKLTYKVKTHLLCLLRARKLGITFLRNKTFDIPNSILIRNERFILSLPKKGAYQNFLETLF